MIVKVIMLLRSGLGSVLQDVFPSLVPVMNLAEDVKFLPRAVLVATYVSRMVPCCPRDGVALLLGSMMMTLAGRRFLFVHLSTSDGRRVMRLSRWNSSQEVQATAVKDHKTSLKHITKISCTNPLKVFTAASVEVWRMRGGVSEETGQAKSRTKRTVTSFRMRGRPESPLCISSA